MKPEGDGWSIASEHLDEEIPYTLWRRVIPRDPQFAPGMQFHFDFNYDKLINEVCEANGIDPATLTENK